MDFDLTQQLEQKQILSQQQIYSLNILEMNNYDLKCFLQDQELENPLLQVDFDGAPDTGGEKYGGEQGPELTERQEYRGEKTRVRKASEPSDQYYDIPDHRQETVSDYLRAQLNHFAHTEREERLLYFLTDLVDDNGYLRFTVDELSFLTGCPYREMEWAVREIQSLTPTGVGAYDLADCLRLQAEQACPGDSTLLNIIAYHLEDIAGHRYQRIADAQGISLNQAKKYGGVIRTFNPKPLNGLTAAHSTYVVPDIIYSFENSHWFVYLNDRWAGSVSLNRDYENLDVQQTDAAFRSYYSEKKKQAVFLSNCVEKRRQTILKLARFLLTYQQPFFEGTGPLKALTLKQAAQAVGLHESTVSRAIRDKYVQTPRITLPMKTFFASAIGGGRAEGGDAETQVSTDAIKLRIKSIIREENKKKPYSDSKLVTLLEQEGIAISRRTVAKYRVELGIPTSGSRKAL